MAKNRTIQHPGFEYFETENYNFSSAPNTKSESMALGYCARGPIGEPIRISSIDQFIQIFGKPENEQEFYLYKGVESVVSRSRSILIVRLPYDNTLTHFKKYEEKTFDKFFKILRGNFKIAKDSTAKYNDLQTAYRNNVTFKTIEFEPDITSFDDVIGFNSEQFDDDFIIVNKYNEQVSKIGEEYIVSVYGTANALRKQNLSYDTNSISSINYFKIDNDGKSEIFNEDDETKLTFSKRRVYWQTNGDINEDNESLTVADSYFDDNVEYIPTIATYEEYIKQDILGVPSATIEFYTDKMINNIVGTEETYESLFDVNLPEKTLIINYNDKVETGTPLLFDMTGAVIEVVKTPDETDYETDEMWYLNSSYRLNFYNENGNLTRSYPLKFTYSTEYGKNYKWKLELEEQYARVKLTEEQKSNGYGEYVYFVDQERSNNITVVVSKIVPSNLESGRYIFEPVEVFSGSIFKGSINESLKQSNYIGDIINYNSNIISFYGKKEYESYDKNTDSILVEQTMPYRFAVINNGRINLESDELFNLNKIIIKQTSIDNGASLNDLVIDLLSKTKNFTKYTYRDVYDFGLSSVLTYSYKDDKGNYFYKPEEFNSSEISDVQFLNIGQWKRIVKAFTKHCQYDHKYSMFHADGPRKLVLNGNLSRTDDLVQDALNIVITGKKAQAVSIRDSSYGQTNIQWFETSNEFTYINTWIPCSIKLAADVTSNDIINNIWDAPAGHRYGVVSNFIRLAINPNYELSDRLYSNCLNYAIMWPNGTTTIEGQKTQLMEQSALNRINVRRLMIYLERYAQSISVKYLYQPNNSFTREHILNDLNAEFSRIKNAGGLYSYRLVCDSNNNPPQVIDNNELRISILLQPSKILEFVVAQFVITKTGVNLEEVDASTF